MKYESDSQVREIRVRVKLAGHMGGNRYPAIYKFHSVWNYILPAIN